MKKIILMLALATWGILYSAIVSGYIYDAATGEPIRYANIMVRKSSMGTQTNRQGYFSLSFANRGKRVLQFTQISYKTVLQEINIDDKDKDIELRIEMEKSSVKVDGIQVIGEITTEVNTREIKVGTIFTPAQELASLPQVAESDLMRSLMALPGVTPVSDFSNGMYVRGGSPDQNLIKLDDTDIYNPAHFGGVFSTFNTDAIDTVELMKGGYPSYYGGRLSSVLNITNRDGNRKDFTGTLKLSMISASTTLEGPWRIGKLKGSWMGSFRRTYIDALKPFYDEIPDYYFYDGHGKVNFDLSNSNKASVSFYNGKDNLLMDIGGDFLMSWGNSAYTGQWTHIFNPGVFGHFVLSHSHFESSMDYSDDGSLIFLRSNYIDDVTFRAKISHRFNDKNTADYGFESKFMDIFFVTDSDEQYDEDGMPYIDSKSITNSIFYHHNYTTDNFWTFEPGIRFNHYRNMEISLPSSKSSDNFNISPRFSIRRQLDFNSNVYFSTGRFYQYLALASADESSPLDIWFPIDNTVKPAVSNHFILGYKHQISDYLAFESEAYYKTYDNLLEYDMATDATWDNTIMTMSNAFHEGNGESVGVDLQLRNDWNGIQGFVAYTFGVTKRKMDGYNSNPYDGSFRKYYPRYDRTNQVNLVENLNYTQLTGKEVWGAEFKFGMNLSYYTGQPYREPERVFSDGENYYFLNSYADKVRLPDYLRLDLNFKLKWQMRRYSLEPYIEIINATNHANTWYRIYTAEENDGILSVEHEDVSMFPFLPFLGLNIEF